MIVGLLDERLSPRFNWMTHEQIFMDFHNHAADRGQDPRRLINYLPNELRKAYFLHFAGSMGAMMQICDFTEQAGPVLV